MLNTMKKKVILISFFREGIPWAESVPNKHLDEVRF